MKAHILKLCPVCKKGFDASEKRSYKQSGQITCSEKCNSIAQTIRRNDPKKYQDMMDSTKDAVLPARKTCIMYDPKSDSCTGLTGLWCTVEECSFYKPKKVFPR